MGGLDYLNKKVWHPGSMKNIQKVWEQEQKQREINKKAKQRAKKLQQQRHNEELKKIQVEAGMIPRSHLDRMEWMYDLGNKLQQQKTNQEYLTGQKKADPHARKQFKHVFQQQVTNNKCEDFALLYEDPMFEIQRREKERRDAIVNNPIQMKKIIKQIESDYLVPVRSENLHDRKKKSKKDKKDRKRSKKEKKDKKDKKEREVGYSKRQERRNSSCQQSRQSSSQSRSDRQRSRDKRKNKKSSSRRRRQRSSQQSSSHSSHSHSDSSSSQQIQSRKSAPVKKMPKLVQQYLKQRFGGMLKREEDGSLKVDYGMHRKKYKTEYQLDEEERRRKLEEMRGNARQLREEREEGRGGGRGGDNRDGNGDNRKQQQQQQKQQYQKGVNNLRQKMYQRVKQNRNMKQYKQEEYEQEC